jgi:RNA polymerase sigma factor (sigma-70 family)
VDEPSAELLARLARDESGAADELFHRYLGRMTQLARSRLSPRLARRLDAEDVAMSAYRSFFVGAREGKFTLQRSGDLWRLLVTITLRKLQRSAAHHAAGKRPWRREEPALPNEFLPDPTSEPSAAEALSLADELGHFLASLEPVRRRVLELRLLERTLPEIAADIGRSERTVRRMLDELQVVLRRRLDNQS